MTIAASAKAAASRGTTSTAFTDLALNAYERALKPKTAGHDPDLSLRALDARLALLHDTLDARAESLRVVRRRAETGYAATLDLQQAPADYHATEQLIPATELAIRRQDPRAHHGHEPLLRRVFAVA